MNKWNYYYISIAFLNFGLYFGHHWMSKQLKISYIDLLEGASPPAITITLLNLSWVFLLIGMGAVANFRIQKTQSSPTIQHEDKLIFLLFADVLMCAFTAFSWAIPVFTATWDLCC